MIEFQQVGVPGYPIVTVAPEAGSSVLVTGAPNGTSALEYAELAGYEGPTGTFQLGTAKYRVYISTF